MARIWCNVEPGAERVAILPSTDVLTNLDVAELLILAAAAREPIANRDNPRRAMTVERTCITRSQG
jgi:hypothetical protein